MQTVAVVLARSVINVRRQTYLAALAGPVMLVLVLWAYVFGERMVFKPIFTAFTVYSVLVVIKRIQGSFKFVYAVQRAVVTAAISRVDRIYRFIVMRVFVICNYILSAGTVYAMLILVHISVYAVIAVLSHAAGSAGAVFGVCNSACIRNVVVGIVALRVKSFVCVEAPAGCTFSG